MRTTATITAADLLANLNATALAAILRGNSNFVRSDASQLAVIIKAEPIPTSTSELDARVHGLMPPPPETMMTTTLAETTTMAAAAGADGGC